MLIIVAAIAGLFGVSALIDFFIEKENKKLLTGVILSLVAIISIVSFNTFKPSQITISTLTYHSIEDMSTVFKNDYVYQLTTIDENNKTETQLYRFNESLNLDPDYAFFVKSDDNELKVEKQEFHYSTLKMILSLKDDYSEYTIYLPDNAFSFDRIHLNGYTN